MHEDPPYFGGRFACLPLVRKYHPPLLLSPAITRSTHRPQANPNITPGVGLAWIAHLKGQYESGDLVGLMLLMRSSAPRYTMRFMGIQGGLSLKSKKRWRNMTVLKTSTTPSLDYWLRPLGQVRWHSARKWWTSTMVKFHLLAEMYPEIIQRGRAPRTVSRPPQRSTVVRNKEDKLIVLYSPRQLYLTRATTSRRVQNQLVYKAIHRDLQFGKDS